MISKFSWIFVMSLAFFFFSTRSIYAQVIVNEVHPAPSQGNEWIELYNPSTETISLTDWSIDDMLSTPSTIFRFTEPYQLLPNNYLVIEVNNKLNNSGDGVTLRNQENQMIDQFAYTSVTLDRSWSRVAGTTTYELTLPSRNSENPFPTPSPSPSPIITPSPSPSLLPTPLPSPTLSPSPLPTPSPSPLSIYPLTLQLSEIMACPETGESEWIEIFNPDSIAYNLTDWKIRDSTGNSRVVNVPIGPQSFGVLTLSSAILNNDGDTVSLERPDGIKLFSVNFGPCQKGRSILFHQGRWQESSTITKGTLNEFVSTDEDSPEQIQEEFTNSTNVLAEMSQYGETVPTNDFPLGDAPEVSLPEEIQIPSFLLPNTSIETSEQTPLEKYIVSPTISPQDTPLDKKNIFSLFGGGLGAMTLASFSIYKWYTEYCAETNFAFS